LKNVKSQAAFSINQVHAHVWWPTTAIHQNYFEFQENQVKVKCRIIFCFIELEIDSFFVLFSTQKQNIFIMK